jgi:hypothetical protein
MFYFADLFDLRPSTSDCDCSFPRPIFEDWIASTIKNADDIRSDPAVGNVIFLKSAWLAPIAQSVVSSVPEIAHRIPQILKS